MADNRRLWTAADAEELLARADAGGPGAALTARRAAILAERSDPALARRALALVASLEPKDPTPRLALARLHAEAGDLGSARAEAGAVFKDAIDEAARARAAFILGEIARVSGDPVSARASFETVLQIENNLLSRDRANPTAGRWYARAKGRLAELDASAGQLGPALNGAEGALAMLRAIAAHIGETPVLAADIADAEMRLAALELDSDKPASARRRLGEAIGRYEALAVTEKDEPHWRAVLSDAWALAAEADYVRGAADAARDAMDKALQARVRLAAANPDETWALAGVWRLRGALRDALGDAVEAAHSLAQARSLAEAVCARDPEAETPARFLVHTMLDQADQSLRAGVLAAARDAADDARGLAERFAARADASPAWLADAAAAWDRLAEVAHAAESAALAQDAFARAVEFRRRALAADQNNRRLARGLAASLVKLGDASLDFGAHRQARAAYAESANLRLDLAEKLAGEAAAALALAVALERLGLACLAEGDRNAARAAWEDELALADRIFADPDAMDGVRFRAIVGAHLAGAGGRDAETHRRSSLAHFDVLAKAGVLTEREAALRRKLWGG